MGLEVKIVKVDNGYIIEMLRKDKITTYVAADPEDAIMLLRQILDADYYQKGS